MVARDNIKQPGKNPGLSHPWSIPKLICEKMTVTPLKMIYLCLVYLESRLDEQMNHRRKFLSRSTFLWFMRHNKLFKNKVFVFTLKASIHLCYACLCHGVCPRTAIEDYSLAQFVLLPMVFLLSKGVEQGQWHSRRKSIYQLLNEV